MSNFWIRPDGQNTLKGVDDDPTNAPVLPAYLILEFLSNDNQKARDDFLALLPMMNEEEQYRLNEIYAFSTKPKDYPQIVEDKFQKSMGTRINMGNNHLPKTVNTSSNKRSKLRVNQ
tara:strand:+ start:494 stop:844 length:351 start_codon:yes stop_codon:yes gene_type:complete